MSFVIGGIFSSLAAVYDFLQIDGLLVGSATLLGVLAVIGRIPLRYNVRNLVVRWRTTLMTGLAFTLVISLLVVMMAFVKGMVRLTEQSGDKANVVLLGAGVTDEAFSSLGYGDIGNIENQPDIKREDGAPLCSKETYFIINQPISKPISGGPKRRFVQVRGIEVPLISARVHNMKLHTGGVWFSEAGVRASAAQADGESQPTLLEAVVGEGVAREFGRDIAMRDLPSVKEKGRLDVGDTFTLGGRDWMIVGVMQSAGSTFDSEVWAKRALVGKMFGKEAYSTLVLRTDNEVKAAQVKKYFNTDFKEASLQALLETEYFSSLSATSKQFSFAIGIVAVVMAIGGVFGIINTMFAAISQRTKDIGVLRILGYSRWQVLVSFLLESVLIALFGGILGCLLGMAADGWTATSVVGSGQGGGKTVVLKLVVDTEILMSCLVLTLAMGIFGGLVPATLTALRMRPLDSLR